MGICGGLCDTYFFCSGGCVWICEGGCKLCWGWCEPAVIEISDLERRPLKGEDALVVSAKGVKPDDLREVIQAYIGTPLEWVSADRDEARQDLDFKGSVEELLGQTGLKGNGFTYA